MESQNDGRVNELSSKVAALKALTIDIGNEVRSQNALLDTMETDMGQARGLLAGTMQRLTAFSQTAHGKQLMYLTGFVLFVFLVIYYLIR